MKSYLDITGKYLKMQKKRSVLTVIGIILSVALVSGIGTIFSSMFAANMRNTIRDNGDFHATISHVSPDRAMLLAGNVETERAGNYQDLGFAAFAQNEKSEYEPPYKYFSLQALDANATAMMPYHLQEGRMPAAPGEIAVDYWTLKFIQGGAIGGTISLDLGTRAMTDGSEPLPNIWDSKETFTKKETRQYTVVGTLQPGYVSDTNFAHAITFLDMKSLPGDAEVKTVLKLKSQANIQTRIQKMVNLAGMDLSMDGVNRITFNERVLRLLAQSVNETLNSSLIFMVLFIVGLVVLSTIAVIYNAFNISVVERVSQFGLLRCVGASPRQIRRIVFREAAILGLIGIPIGLVAGTFAMDVVFRVIAVVAPKMFIGGSTGLTLSVSPLLLAASAVIGAFTIYLSALLPARKAAGVSPMDAVRGTGAFKKEKYRKTDPHRLVLKLMGTEGWIAWKNLGRNRKRFYITVLSMVISIVLFIVFSSLVGFAFQSGAVDTSDMPNYMLYRNSGKNLGISESELNSIADMQGTDYTLTYADSYTELVLPKNKLDSKAGEFLKDSLFADEQGNYRLMNSDIICYRDSELDTLIRTLKPGSFDRQTFLDGKSVILVNTAELQDREAKKLVLSNMTTLKAGDKVTLATNVDIEGEQPIRAAVQIASVVDKGLPPYVHNQNNGVFLIVSEKLFHTMTPGAPFPRSLMVMMKPDADLTAMKALMNKYADANPDMILTDLDETAKNYRQTWIVMSIFLYGFVTVISIIGCLNIINTISTNIIIRTRELSVMRAVGMNDGAVRRMIALESVLHAAAAALIGSALGTLLSRLLYNSMSEVRGFPWELPWQQILIAVGAAALVAVISGFVPLRRISHAVIIEGIRGEE